MGKSIGGFAKSTLKLADPITKAAGFGTVEDLMFGADQGTLRRSPLAADVERVQLEALKGQEKVLKERKKDFGNFDKEAEKTKLKGQLNFAARKQQQALKTAADDTRRKLRETLAQRGIKGSSLGLAQERGITQRLGEQQSLADATARARIPIEIDERVRQLRDKRLAALEGTSLSTIRSQNVPIRFEDEKLGRSGGLLPAAGGILGGIFGGPAGAQGGVAAGQGLSGIRKFN